MALTPGATFAGYTIIRLLGTGGMGEVYLARHPRLPREDALKIPNPVVTTSAVSPPPYEEESPVQVCMQQTGHGRLRCMREVRRGDTP